MGAVAQKWHPCNPKISMYRRSPLTTALTFLIVSGWSMPLGQARHVHVTAGATAPSVGSKLFFVNGGSLNADSGYLIHLQPVHSSSYGDIFFGGSDITFTSAATTPDHGGPEPFAALPGSHLVQVLDSVVGPPGGEFSFWDSFDGFFDATEITFTVPVGSKNGINQFSLSENDESEGADPYGHIHGRKFSVNLPGLYSVGFRIIDSNHNGPDGGPLHSRSDLAWFNFQAGTTLSDIQRQGDGVVLKFGTEEGKSYYIETSETATGPHPWRTLFGPIDGNDRLQTVEVPLPGGSTAFFRLRVE